MKNWYLFLILCALLAGCTGQADYGVSLDESEHISQLESSQEEPPAIVNEESLEEQPGEEEPEAEEYIFAEEEPVPAAPNAESSAPSAPPTASGGASSAATAPAKPQPSVSSEVSSVPAPAQEITGQSKPSVASDANFLSGVEMEVIGLINAERRALGLGALKHDSKLEQAARIRSRELYQYNYFSHTRPNGDLWQTVLKVDVPVAYTTAGENLAKVEHNMPDYDPAYDAHYWYETWEGSPTHYENMVRSNFTHVGVGIYYRVTNGMTLAYATTTFASY